MSARTKGETDGETGARFTVRQRDILRYLLVTTKAEVKPPSLTEIARAIGLGKDDPERRSKARKALGFLREKGCVSPLMRGGRIRGYVLTEAGEIALDSLDALVRVDVRKPELAMAWREVLRAEKKKIHTEFERVRRALESLT